MRHSVKTIFFICIVFLLSAGCESGPSITPIECLKEDISISAKTGYTGGLHRRDMEVVLEIDLKCKGIPVPDAEIRTDYWWSDSKFIYRTNSNGLMHSERNVMTEPRKQKIGIRVRGSDGEKKEEIIIRDPWH
jgi:hypothetical protein